MKGCAAALVLVLLVASAVLPAPAAGPMPASPLRPRAATTSVSPTVTGDPVAWHPIANTTSTSQMFVDPQRGRILSLTNLNSSDYALQIMDMNGTVLVTVGSVLPYNNDPIAPQGLFDADTGRLYLLDWHVNCRYNGEPYNDSADLIVVDTVNATILHHWWYPIGLEGIALHGDRIYAGHTTDGSPSLGWCFLVKDSAITVLNATDGTIIGNITSLPQGYFTTPPGVDPSGSWLFVTLSDDNWRATTYRLNLTDTTYKSLGTGGYYAFSPDGRQLYVCDAAMLSLRTYSVATGVLSGGGSCGGPMAVNPVTGMIASDGLGSVTWAGSPVSNTPVLRSVAWSPDGRTLLGINASGASPNIGAWDGTPIVGTWPTLLSPWKTPLRVRFDSVQGVNRSSLQFTMDGAPFPGHVTWPLLWQASVNVTSVPDGPHTLTVAGADVVGRVFQGGGTFETDGTPPVIQILSSNRTNATPYGLVGRLNESHPSWVRVDGEAVPLTGLSWFVQASLRIGDNRFFVEAGDTLGNLANRTFHVWYWPPHSDNLTNDADHITVSVPPSWVGELNVSLGGGTLENVTLSVMLIGPPDGSTAATFIVTALPLPDAQETQDYVLKMALWQRDLVANFGGVIVAEPWNDTLDGHPAVTFEALLTSGTDTTLSVVTVAVSSAWKLEYILTFDVSVGLWPAYAASRDWILQGFHIEAPPPAGGPPGQGWEPWSVAAAFGAAAGAAVVVLSASLLRRRRGSPPV